MVNAGLSCGYWDCRQNAQAIYSSRTGGCVPQRRSDGSLLAINRVQQVVDVPRKIRDIGLVEEIQVSAGHGNNVDPALAYGAPSVGA